MARRPPRSTRTDTLFPYTTLFRSVLDRRFRDRGHHGDLPCRNITECWHLGWFRPPVATHDDLRNWTVEAAALVIFNQSILQGRASQNLEFRIERGDRKSTRLNSSH